MKRLHFFAMKEDLLPVLRDFEVKHALKYVRRGHYPSKAYDSYNHGAEIERLGTATADSAVACETFLVCKRETVVNIRPISAIHRYAIDQLLNPDTVTFTPAGLWNNEIMLQGQLATVSNTPPAQDLMKRFYNALRRHYSKIKGFWMGPQALFFLENGGRLTIAVQSPAKFDLRLPSN